MSGLRGKSEVGIGQPDFSFWTQNGLASGKPRVQSKAAWCILRLRTQGWQEGDEAASVSSGYRGGIDVAGRR
jgi:hypothetical protein